MIRKLPERSQPSAVTLGAGGETTGCQQKKDAQPEITVPVY
jgi:hypothetical protein